MKIDKQKASQIIDSFLDGSCGDYDWDDFTSIRQDDVLVESVRLECIEIPDKFPPENPSCFCDEKGMERLRELSEYLKHSVD